MDSGSNALRIFALSPEHGCHSSNRINKLLWTLQSLAVSDPGRKTTGSPPRLFDGSRSHPCFEFFYAGFRNVKGRLPVKHSQAKAKAPVPRQKEPCRNLKKGWEQMGADANFRRVPMQSRRMSSSHFAYVHWVS